MSVRRVLFDAGNSSVKWAIVEDGRWQADGRCEYAELSALKPKLTAGARCFVASVASPTHEAKLAALLQDAGTSVVWLKSEAAFADVTNGYRNPGQLGVDRWMCLLAARARNCGAMLVVSVGTAMTVDALSAGGEFLGGIIVPGVDLMRNALQQGTARVAPADGVWQAFPLCTADAAYSGIVAALCGAVQSQYGRLAALAGAAPGCLITGGGADELLRYLSVDAEHVPMLVLEGVDRVARMSGR